MQQWQLWKGSHCARKCEMRCFGANFVVSHNTERLFCPLSGLLIGTKPTFFFFFLLLPPLLPPLFPDNNIISHRRCPLERGEGELPPRV